MYQLHPTTKLSPSSVSCRILSNPAVGIDDVLWRLRVSDNIIVDVNYRNVRGFKHELEPIPSGLASTLSVNKTVVDSAEMRFQLQIGDDLTKTIVMKIRGGGGGGGGMSTSTTFFSLRDVTGVKKLVLLAAGALMIAILVFLIFSTLIKSPAGRSLPPPRPLRGGRAHCAGLLACWFPKLYRYLYR